MLRVCYLIGDRSFPKHSARGIEVNNYAQVAVRSTSEQVALLARIFEHRIVVPALHMAV